MITTTKQSPLVQCRCTPLCHWRTPQWHSICKPILRLFIIIGFFVINIWNKKSDSTLVSVKALFKIIVHAMMCLLLRLSITNVVWPIDYIGVWVYGTQHTKTFFLQKVFLRTLVIFSTCIPKHCLFPFLEPTLARSHLEIAMTVMVKIIECFWKITCSPGHVPHWCAISLHW